MSIPVLKQNFMPKKIRFFALITLSLWFVSSCHTIGEKQLDQQAEEKVMESQKSLVVSYLNKGEAGSAHQELRKLIKEYPKDADFQNLMGLTQLALGYPAKALQYFQAAYKKQTTGAVALNISSALIALKKNKEAISFIQKSRKKHSDYMYQERFLHNLGLAWENLKRPKNAEKYYRLALSENPNNYPSVVKLGSLYKKTKRLKKAEEQFRKASEQCPICLEPTNFLVEQHLRAGDKQLALNTLQKYIANEEVSSADKQKATNLLKKIDSKPKK